MDIAATDQGVVPESVEEIEAIINNLDTWIIYRKKQDSLRIAHYSDGFRWAINRMKAIMLRFYSLDKMESLKGSKNDVLYEQGQPTIDQVEALEGMLESIGAIMPTLATTESSGSRLVST